MACVTLFLCLCRLLLFHLFESPKWLASRGRQREAVAVIHALAWYKGRTTWLSEDLLDEIGGKATDAINEKTPFKKTVRNSVTRLYHASLQPLFSNTRLGIRTAPLWFCWTLLDTAMPLFASFLPGLLSKVDDEAAAVPSSVVYRATLVATLTGIFGCLAARFLVGIRLGRKWSMALTTFLASIFIFSFTLAKTSNQQQAISCSIVFSLYAAWEILYMSTSESFPTQCRATGFGIAAALLRIGGIIAPFLAVNAGQGHAKVLV